MQITKNNNNKTQHTYALGLTPSHIHPISVKRSGLSLDIALQTAMMLTPIQISSPWSSPPVSINTRFPCSLKPGDPEAPCLKLDLNRGQSGLNAPGLTSGWSRGHLSQLKARVLNDPPLWPIKWSVALSFTSPTWFRRGAGSRPSSCSTATSSSSL